MNKLKADGTGGMLATSRSRVLQLLSKNMNTEICIGVVLPVELGLSP